MQIILTYNEPCDLKF